MSLLHFFGDRSLSYRELNRRANQLAHHLNSLGVSSNSLVGIYLDRSLDMLVGLLAILKAGAAYIPLDPNYPQERIVFYVGRFWGISIINPTIFVNSTRRV
ncbi:MAG: amino acid adenylation domain-containing protein [Hydrococcus sp. SU_1_0]|nr:amino acid adenylation domain-containing protein [Hydrococcus sp. SU_1_0]